ncbi:hypothetical protein CAPTEDRAFT_221283 [Capitella teleta]|uniref:Uncharacterized protein n=1 Tax=Capitella teleta TaxID=283909 RepID=R7TL26_CAPTE|nr:hypothetical protein CAPTEDRAFT_221283 [Capitella teleta]|eukprot:ELT94349.1 hypothetical protein CAPTEDRAFT_221283 [Capitella teleta]
MTDNSAPESESSSSQMSPNRRSKLRLFLTLIPFSILSFLIFQELQSKDNLTPKTLSLDGIYVPEPGLEGDLLVSLGFIAEPRLYPQSYHMNTELPVFVIALGPEDINSFHRFLGSFRIYYREKRLVVYNLGITGDERNMIKQTCQCIVREVHWERYPSHVRDLGIKAFRPFLIQETLHEFGVVFWTHAAMRFNSSNLDALRHTAETHGISTWPMRNLPTSSLTHYQTLRYLHEKPSNLRFQRMAEPNMALYYNTYRLHYKLMMPWVKCALEKECVAPRAARSKGCQLQKPRYLYTGCHSYDTSVFNVLLGKTFLYETPYMSEKPVFQLEYVKGNA